MNITYAIGIFGSLLLLCGAAWPEKRSMNVPTNSIKNWLFLTGSLILLAFSILQYKNGGSIFFVILEILVNISSILMMINASDRIDTVIIGTSGLALTIWSLLLFEGYETIIFILGLCGISLGFALQMGSTKRDIALTLGSLLIAIYSYMEASWIFFWLNSFFTIFSAYYLYKGLTLNRIKNNK